MKRLFVSVALLPLAWAATAQAETKISTAVTAPVSTATAASGAPDDLTIEAAGSVKPTASGAAVTLNSNNQVKNAGAIGFQDVDNATGILVLGGRGGGVVNSGAITLLEDVTPEDTDKDGDLDGPVAKGSGRFGVRVTGPGAFGGDIRNDVGGAITVEGNDSAGISVETRLNGSLFNAGTVSVTGDRSMGIAAGSVAGNVRITGAVAATGEGATGVRLDTVDGQVLLQSAITATGYRATDRLADAARAKLDADDLRQGGAAVRITGDVGKGILLDRAPADLNPDDKDEDKDGVDDALEGAAVLTSFGSAPALDLGSDRATTIGAVGTGDAAYGLVIKGSAVASGVNDGVAATAVRIGQAGGGAVTVAGGVNNAGGTIGATAYGAQATGLLLNAGAVVPGLRNSGSILAAQNGGQQDAVAVADLSGRLSLVENTGIIRATVTGKAGETATGKAIALDLRANTSGAVVRQTKAAAESKPVIEGDVLFGSGDDRLELFGGTLTGTMSFGAGADTLVLDGAAQASGRIVDADGRLTIDVREGRLAVANMDTVQLSSLSLGAKSVLAVAIDPTAQPSTRFRVSGVAAIASGAQVDISLTSLLTGPATYELVRAGTLQAGGTGASLAGAPYLYAANLRTDVAAGALVVDLRPKTAAELGLNRSGAQAYKAVFAALGRDDRIEAAALAQKTQGGFQSFYDQMLPDHSGASLMSAAAISGAISQAVGQPLARDGHGGTAIWAQEILFRIDRDRDQAAGYRTNGLGLAAGAEMVGETTAVGLNLSVVMSDYKDRGALAGERVAMTFSQAGLYWRLRTGGFQADARAGLGYVWFDGKRRFNQPGVDLTANADWNGWVADAHAGASYAVKVGRFTARPEVSVDYLRLSEGAYQEAGGGDGFDLAVAKRKGDLLTGQALLALGYTFGDETWWAPEVKVGWREKLAGDAGRTTAHFAGGESFTMDPEAPFAGGAIVRFGVKGGGDQVFVALDAGAALDDGYKEYDLRGTLRFRF